MGGTFTSAYQAEGSDEDGKGLSIQDIQNPKKIADFKVASVHYHHIKEAVKLMAELGLRAYRFSISWVRIFPKGEGEFNLHFTMN